MDGPGFCLQLHIKIDNQSDEEPQIGKFSSRSISTVQSCAFWGKSFLMVGWWL